MSRAYAVIHKNSRVRMLSRSGGIFTALSDYILEHGGVVYGCVLNKDLLAVHVRATDKLVRDQMRGSKYIQSDMSQVMKQLVKDVAENRLVLFTGTTCQVVAVRAMFHSNPENLILMDVVCHGVPSPSVWKRYIRWVEKKYSSKCSSADFRNKIDFGWRAHIETLYVEKKSYVRKVSQNYFRTLFYRHNVLRPACFNCPYKTLNRITDISIADCWGIEKVAPQMDDNCGVSLVLIGTVKGEQLFSAVSSDLEIASIDVADCMQPSFVRPVDVPKERTEFWRDFYEMEFIKVLKKYADYGIYYSCLNRIKKAKHKLKSCLFENL